MYMNINWEFGDGSKDTVQWSCPKRPQLANRDCFLDGGCQIIFYHIIVPHSLYNKNLYFTESPVDYHIVVPHSLYNKNLYFTENPVDYHIIVPHSLYNNNLFCTFRKRVDALKSLQMFCLFYHRSTLHSFPVVWQCNIVVPSILNFCALYM